MWGAGEMRNGKGWCGTEAGWHVGWTQKHFMDTAGRETRWPAGSAALKKHEQAA